MPIGARIRTRFQRPDSTLVAAFSGLASCDVADGAGRMHVAASGISHMGGPTHQIAGPAVTVLCRPDDNLMIHAAIDSAKPGDIIVVSAGGGTETALVGEMVTRHAASRGIIGFIVDGAVRDSALLAVPVYARGRTPQAPFRQAAGEVGFPVGLGSVAVNPGDIVVADIDGVVVVPLADAATVLSKAQAIAAKDQTDRTLIATGKYDRSWLPGALKAAGVMEEEV